MTSQTRKLTHHNLTTHTKKKRGGGGKGGGKLMARRQDLYKCKKKKKLSNLSLSLLSLLPRISHLPAVLHTSCMVLN